MLKDIFERCLQDEFFKISKNNNFLLLFIDFLCAYLNVASLSLVTKLSSFNYYRSQNQNTGVKDLYATMILKNHFNAINQRYCAKFPFQREKVRGEKVNIWLGI